MRIGIYVSPFNPITADHIAFARNKMKEMHFDRVVFRIDDTACEIDRAIRYRMIQNAIHPYRRFLCGVCDERNAIVFSNPAIETSGAEVWKSGFAKVNYVNRKLICGNGLYLKDYLKTQLKDKRFIHSCSVASLSAMIAQKHFLSASKAYLIGLYHDMTKYMDQQQSSSIMAENGYYEMNMPPDVWHGATAFYLLKHIYKLQDKEMLQAIRHHTLGDHTGPYSMILFIADKTEPTRGYDSSREIEMACKDLNKAFERVKRQMKIYLQNQKKHNECA